MSADSDSHSLDAEHSVLGGLLLDNDAWDKIADVVSERDFYAVENRKVYRALSRLLEAGKTADLITVSEFLETHHELENVGGLAGLATLMQSTPSAANIRRYAEIVRERSVIRALGRALAEGGEAISNRAGRSAKDLLDFVQSKVMAVSESAAKGTEGPQHVGSVLDDVMRQIDELSNNPHRSDVTGLATGFAELDKMTTGFQPGELIIVAARPAMGKTAFALNISEFVALPNSKNVAFFSLEMANNQLGVRLLASVARLNQQRVKIGRLNEAEFERLYKASSALRETHLFLDEEGSLSANELRARARRLHRECGGLHLVVIDYIGLMEGSGKSDNRAYEVAEISRALKLLAKELHIPVIALAQLNRGLEARPNKRPILSDLRDSGGIEQDADVVLFIYRDEVYNEDSPDKGIAEIIIGKQRNGPTGTVHVGFVGECTRFEDRHRSAPVPSKLARIEKMSKRVSGGNRSYRDERDGVPM